MNTIYTAVDLLEKIFDFEAKTPNRNEWSVKKLQGNLPRIVRLQQIESLLIAFDLHESQAKTSRFARQPSVADSILNVLHGTFVDPFNEDAIAAVDQYAAFYVTHSDDFQKLTTDDVRFVYRNLLQFKKNVYDVQHFNSGWLECGGKVGQLSIGITKTVVSNLEGTTKELDYVLNLILNPKQRSFTQEELVEHYHYPTADLFDLDLDYM